MRQFSEINQQGEQAIAEFRQSLYRDGEQIVVLKETEIEVQTSPSDAEIRVLAPGWVFTVASDNGAEIVSLTEDGFPFVIHHDRVRLNVAPCQVCDGYHRRGDCPDREH